MNETGTNKPHLLTAVVPNKPLVAPDLALLLAPVCAAEPSAPDEYVGRADGVLLDTSGHVVAFILRLARKIDASGARTLVPISALTFQEGPILRLSWTEDQLRAEPRLDSHLHPHNFVDGGPPVESQWMPAKPSVVPPGAGANGAEAAKEGVEGGLIGAAIGALAGLAIGGPIGAASLAVFFAAGGSLAGLLAGASEESAIEAGEMHFSAADRKRDETLGMWLGRLEDRLKDPMLASVGLLTVTPVTPSLTLEAPPVEPRRAAGWR